LWDIGLGFQELISKGVDWELKLENPVNSLAERVLQKYFNPIWGFGIWGPKWSLKICTNSG